MAANANWTKEVTATGGADGTQNLLEYRMEKLEGKVDEMAKGLAEVRDILNRMVVTQTGITATNCVMHNTRMTELEKSNAELKQNNDRLEGKIEGINKKIITWTAVASVVVFLIAQLIFPFIINNVRLTTARAAEPVTLAAATNQYTINWPTNLQPHP